MEVAEEELPDGEGLVYFLDVNIMLMMMMLLWFLWNIPYVVFGGWGEGQHIKRESRGVLGENNKKNQTDLLELCKNLIGLLLRRHIRVLYFLHPPDVLGKVGGQDGVDRGVVDGDNVLDHARRAEGESHGRLCAPGILVSKDPQDRQESGLHNERGNLHGVADEGGILQLVLLYEGPDVLCHGGVIMAGVVGGVTMVAEILYETGGDS